MISIIAIIGKNRELGKNNQLIWNIPEDLKRFRSLTLGHPVIMGRKTFESIGRPLPHRTNIVITTQQTDNQENVIRASSLDDAMRYAQESPGSEEIFIIGGGVVYAQAIHLAQRLYLTIVDGTDDEADTFFPDYSEFTRELEHTQHQSSTGYYFSYKTLEKEK